MQQATEMIVGAHFGRGRGFLGLGGQTRIMANRQTDPGIREKVEQQSGLLMGTAAVQIMLAGAEVRQVAWTCACYA